MYDEDSDNWVKTPEFWGFMHYSRFIDVNSKRIDINISISNVFASCYINDTKTTLVLVQILNNNNNDYDFNIDLA